ncbi:uncharacterized protein EV154DRAFT_510002 [Mucor mucedo]|uniref:uncharacterized protein n=1 Tax=Mucor mucedo TaxID=29922 RepID=UPI00221F60D7|nr:uncharacterized protein EV154DRAFT_510002 [Mucor mucedo]KAI7890923.1 hypothetical protein EV154DRAFT_510002 [Mucor mucedo]
MVQVTMLSQFFFLSEGLLARDTAIMNHDGVAKSFILLNIRLTVHAKITVTRGKTFHFFLMNGNDMVHGFLIRLIQLVAIRTCFFSTK